MSDPRRRRVGAASPAIAPSGDLFVLYQDYGGDVADFEGLPGGIYEGAFSLVVSRSTNGGATFSDTGVVESTVVGSERFLVFVPKFPSLAIDPRSGRLYVAWSDLRNGDSDVFVRRSDDRGKTWSRPVRVDNAEDSPRQQQYLPKLAVAPNGRADVLFLDRDDRDDRDDPLHTTAVLSSSFDKGGTWDAVTVSDQPFDARRAPQRAERPRRSVGRDRHQPRPGLHHRRCLRGVGRQPARKRGEGSAGPVLRHRPSGPWLK